MGFHGSVEMFTFSYLSDRSSLQCCSVLSTIAQVLRKMKLKNLVS